MGKSVVSRLFIYKVIIYFKLREKKNNETNNKKTKRSFYNIFNLHSHLNNLKKKWWIHNYLRTLLLNHNLQGETNLYHKNVSCIFN